jgi:hypothetical protein
MRFLCVSSPELRWVASPKILEYMVFSLRDVKSPQLAFLQKTYPRMDLIDQEPLAFGTSRRLAGHTYDGPRQR